MTQNIALQHLMSIKAKFTDFEIQGVKYKAKELTGEEFKEYQADIIELSMDSKGKPQRKFKTENVVEALVFTALYDENEKRVFKKADKALVGKLPQAILNEIFPHVAAVNGIGSTEEETEKNLKAIQKD